MQWSTFVNIIAVSDDVSVLNLKLLAMIVRTIRVHSKGSSKWGNKGVMSDMTTDL